jgi:guanylate kinase
MKESSRNGIHPLLPSGPLLIVISGPSGVGKDAVIHRLKEIDFPVLHVITMTTRPKRPSEQDGREYHFVPEEKFRELIANGGLLEWAEVYGNFYGVPREAVRKGLEQGRDVLVKVDIQGAATIKKLIPQAVTVFITPPSMDELVRRLTGRRTESKSSLELRLKTAQEEMEKISFFDYAVVNRLNKVDAAVAQIDAIINAEKCRTGRQEISL